MFEVVVERSFSAAHFLKLYDGSFEPRHGHDWKVQVLVTADVLDKMEVVVDFEALKPQLKTLLAEFEGTCVNDLPEFKGKLNPSTENIAKVIFEKLEKQNKSKTAKIAKVTVFETPDARASYKRG